MTYAASKASCAKWHGFAVNFETSLRNPVAPHVIKNHICNQLFPAMIAFQTCLSKFVCSRLSAEKSQWCYQYCAAAAPASAVSLLINMNICRPALRTS